MHWTDLEVSESGVARGGGAKGLVLDWLSGEVTAGSARALKDLVEAATALME